MEKVTRTRPPRKGSAAGALADGRRAERADLLAWLGSLESELTREQVGLAHGSAARALSAGMLLMVRSLGRGVRGGEHLGAAVRP
jgi:hypothetical protein